MKLELKSIKYAEFASEETACFEGILFVDGVKVAHISNDGHGGSDNVQPIKDRESFNKIMPTVHAQFTGDDTLESWCGAQIDEFLITRELTKLLKNKVVFIKDGSAYTAKPVKGIPMERAIAAVSKKHEGCLILNTMDKAEALAAYKKCA